MSSESHGPVSPVAVNVEAATEERVRAEEGRLGSYGEPETATWLTCRLRVRAVRPAVARLVCVPLHDRPPAASREGKQFSAEERYTLLSCLF